MLLPDLPDILELVYATDVDATFLSIDFLTLEFGFEYEDFSTISAQEPPDSIYSHRERFERESQGDSESLNASDSNMSLNSFEGLSEGSSDDTSSNESMSLDVRKSFSVSWPEESENSNMENFIVLYDIPDPGLFKILNKHQATLRITIMVRISYSFPLSVEGSAMIGSSWLKQ